MDICGCSVLPPAILGNEPKPSSEAIVCIEVLQVSYVRPSELARGVEEIVLDFGVAISTVADMYGTVETMMPGVASAVVRLDLGEK